MVTHSVENSKIYSHQKIFRQINSLVTYKQNRYFHGISLTLISVTPKEKGVAFRCYYFYFPKYFCYSKLKLYLDFVFHTIGIIRVNSTEDDICACLAQKLSSTTHNSLIDHNDFSKTALVKVDDTIKT